MPIFRHMGEDVQTSIGKNNTKVVTVYLNPLFLQGSGSLNEVWARKEGSQNKLERS